MILRPKVFQSHSIWKDAPKITPNVSNFESQGVITLKTWRVKMGKR